MERFAVRLHGGQSFLFLILWEPFSMRRIAWPLFLGFCSSLGGLTATVFVSRGQPTAHARDGAETEINRLGERFELIARKFAPAVVAIDAIKPPSADKKKPVEESGSGVLVRLPGQRSVFALTNNHVIQGAEPKKITVSLYDNRLLKPVQVWADPESDVAVLRLDGLENVTTATLGDSEQVRVGQWVLAFGSPFGLNQTVTHGIISARERGQISLGPTIRIKEFLQTDAAINPGSSGGPLVNLQGEVVGINTAIASNSGASSGVAFSIPINLVVKIAQQLLEKGSVTRGYLGCQVTASFEPADAEKLGLDRVQGALVEKVYVDTPAAAAGLRPNDVILRVDETTVRNENHFINIVSSQPPGKRIKLHIWRDRRATVVEAVVGDWAKGQARLKPNS
jgi:S1-C subfamily serine protease